MHDIPWIFCAVVRLFAFVSNLFSYNVDEHGCEVCNSQCMIAFPIVKKTANLGSSTPLFFLMWRIYSGNHHQNEIEQYYEKF